MNIIPTAPHLAIISNALMGRPAGLRDLALEVDPELYELACAEMETVMRDRGFPLPRRPDLDRPNFLLLGVPITPAG